MKNLLPPPLLLCYIFEKCKPYCKWRGVGAAQILSVKLILRLHISNYRFYLNMGNGSDDSQNNTTIQ